MTKEQEEINIRMHQLLNLGYKFDLMGKKFVNKKGKTISYEELKTARNDTWLNILSDLKKEK